VNGVLFSHQLTARTRRTGNSNLINATWLIVAKSLRCRKCVHSIDSGARGRLGDIMVTRSQLRVDNYASRDIKGRNTLAPVTRVSTVLLDSTAASTDMSAKPIHVQLPFENASSRPGTSSSSASMTSSSNASAPALDVSTLTCDVMRKCLITGLSPVPRSTGLNPARNLWPLVSSSPCHYIARQHALPVATTASLCPHLRKSRSLRSPRHPHSPDLGTQ
jgi:hypothetical protein